MSPIETSIPTYQLHLPVIQTVSTKIPRLPKWCQKILNRGPFFCHFLVVFARFRVQIMSPVQIRATRAPPPPPGMYEKDHETRLPSEIRRRQSCLTVSELCLAHVRLPMASGARQHQRNRVALVLLSSGSGRRQLADRVALLLDPCRH